MWSEQRGLTVEEASRQESCSATGEIRPVVLAHSQGSQEVKNGLVK